MTYRFVHIQHVSILQLKLWVIIFFQTNRLMLCVHFGSKHVEERHCKQSTLCAFLIHNGGMFPNIEAHGN